MYPDGYVNLYKKNIGKLKRSARALAEGIAPAGAQSPIRRSSA